MGMLGPPKVFELTQRVAISGITTRQYSNSEEEEWPGNIPERLLGYENKLKHVHGASGRMADLIEKWKANEALRESKKTES